MAKRTITVENGMMTVRTEDRRKRRNAKLVTAGILVVCFAILAFLVKTGRTVNFDHTVDYFVYGLRNPAATAFYSVYTRVASGPVIVAWIVLLVLIPKTRNEFGWKMGIPSAIIFVCYKGLKSLMARPRPDVALHLVTEDGYSFPSGHSLNGLFCYALLLWLVLRYLDRKGKLTSAKRIGLTVLTVAVILLVGFSRIYLGVHYVTDVLGGFILGTAAFLVVTEILIALEDRKAPGIGYRGKHEH